jgi:PKD repeat protein
MKAAGERLAIDSAALSDSGGYYCVIKNPAGAATSDTARLMVKNAPPSATVVMPDSIGIAAGKAAAFTVAAAGTRPFTYAWYKEREGPDSLMAAAGDTLKFRSTGIPDSGRYYCIVRNPAGADTSAPARLVIIPKPRAAFSFAPKSGTAPLDVAFSDRSAGEISARLWTFGDDSLSALLNPTHPFVKAGLFTVSLIVSGPGGSDTCRKSDSVFVYTEGQNPVRIAARFLTGTNVELTINNLGDVDTSLPPPRCDSLGIWYRPKAIPTSSIDGKILVTYRRSEFKTGRILDTVSLPGTDTVFGLMSALFWGGGTLSDFHLANGCAVLLKDTGSSGLSEAVSLLDPAEGSDTVDAFKGKILLWKDASYGGKTGLRDTLLLLPSYICPEGMIVVGRPFVFKKGSSGPPFAVGMRIDSLPANRSLRDVRIYTDSAGAAIVNWETAIDSARHLVFVVTGDLRRPFVAMIDTAPPAAEVVSDTANYAVEGGSLTDSLRIFDNIINVRWRYFAGKGDEQPLLRQEGETHRTGERIDLTLADSINALSSLTGLRAFVLVGDAVHWDTIDLSRSVARAQSDKQTASAGVWTPVYPTSRLFQKSADSLIARLSSSGTARYDARYYRLFRWVAYEGNRDQTDKWVEFNPSQGGVRSLFTLEPGRLLWLKPRGDLSFDLDSGATLSLRDTFKILLPPQQWTDFGMPLRFGVRMEEILSASGSGADSVLFFRWRKNDASSRFMLEPLYVPGMPDKLDRSAPVEYLPKEGYSFFNRSSRIIVVRIPPVPASTAKPLGKKTAKTGETWCGKFVARDQGGASLPAVYFGYAAGIKISAYPLVPSFGGIRLCVFDRSAGKSYGHHIGEDAKNGLIKELRITNDADSVQHLGFRMQRVGALPGNYSVYCYDAAAKRFDTAGSISVGPKSAASRWIIIGDAAFQRRFIASKLALQFSLRSLYPNPARRAVTIRYTVPFGSEERIRIAIYSPVGKRLWEKRIEGPLVEGDHVVTWDGADSRRGPAASGLYIVRMEVIDPAGHAVKQFERRLTLVK